MATVLEGARVTLYDASWNQLLVKTTDSTGNFSFPGLPDGDYYLGINDYPPTGTIMYSGGYYKQDGAENMACVQANATKITIANEQMITGLTMTLKAKPLVPGTCVYV